jgi:hypothetical protein
MKMSVKIDGKIYLTVPEATFLLGIKPSLMAHYIYRGEFSGIIYLNEKDHFQSMINESGIVIDHDKVAAFFNRERKSYLIPADSVVEKYQKRSEKISRREAKKKQKETVVEMNGGNA